MVLRQRVSERGPHRSYMYPWALHTPPYPTKISLFGILCIISSELLDLYFFSLVFLHITLTFQVFSNLFLFLFSLFIFKLLEFHFFFGMFFLR
jgi:hypothetical protein